MKYTLERHLNASGSFRRSEIGAMDHVEVVDPLTVRVVMRQAFSPFVAILTDRAGMMVAPKAAEAGGKNFGLHPVCAGPFRFVERVAQDHITLERFPAYWDASRIHYERVTYRIIPDSSIRLANLQAGTLDITEIAPLDAQTVQRDPKLALVSVPSLGYGALTINIGGNPKADTPLGRDARVRHAFELALDRDALNQVVFAGTYQPNAQATSPLSPLYVEEIAPTKRDVAKARALLKEAGVTTPFPVPLIVYNTPQGVQTGEVIQSMAAEAGFAVQVNAMEFGTAIATVQRGDYVMTLGGWSGLLDTDSNAWSFLHTGGALNRAGYSNQHVDELLDRARTASAIEDRRAAYEGVWQQVSQGSADHLSLDPAQHRRPDQEGDRLHAARRRTVAPSGRASGALSHTTGGKAAMQRMIALACIAFLAFGTARADTTLVVSMAADPTGLDPEAVLNNTSGFVMATIYDGLIRYKPGTVEVEPGLAQSWDVSSDGLTYTFHLRKGVKYHDGTPFNASGADRHAGSPAQEG